MGLFSSKADASDSSKDIFSRIDKEASKADMMVNTLGDSDLAKLSAGMKSELAQAEKKNSITGPFTLFGISICYKKEAWELLIYYSKLRHRQTPIGQIINNSPRLITYTIRQYI